MSTHDNIHHSLDSNFDINNIEHLLRGKKLKTPGKVASDDWTLPKLQAHLQWAVDIELFTIPFYMAAMYSIKDEAAEARRLVRSVVNQEMFHMQSAANLANAFGTELLICAPSYGGSIPHLDFSLDQPNPTNIYFPYSTAIGAFDVERINAMCIIEYPDWSACVQKNPSDEYGSIGEFYDSVRSGVEQLAELIQGNKNQVAHFKAQYPGMASLTITKDGREGFPQANTLINAIVNQGEGQAKQADYISSEFQNRADDMQPSWDHFEKFTYLREQPLPETYRLTIGNERSKQVQKILLTHFGEFLKQMNRLFRGKSVTDFGPLMFKVGAGMANCWENGALPVFSRQNNS